MHLFMLIHRNPEVAAHYSWKSAESLMRLSRKRSLPNVPETLKDLADQFDAGLFIGFKLVENLYIKVNNCIIYFIFAGYL